MGTAILVFVCLFGVPFAISKLADYVDKQHQERMLREQPPEEKLVEGFTAYSKDAFKNETQTHT